MNKLIRSLLFLSLLTLLASSLMGCASTRETEIGDVQTAMAEKDQEIDNLRAEMAQRESALKQTEDKLQQQLRAAAEAERRVEELSASQTSGGSAVISGSSGGSGMARNELLPPHAKPGECYARVFVPAVYESHKEEMLHKEATERVELMPAKHEWTHEAVLVSEASKKLVEVPARYEWKEEKVLEQPAHTIWKKGRGLIERVDGNTGEIMCMVEVPAKYRNVRRRVQTTPPTIEEIMIPAVYDTVHVKKMVKAPEVKRVEIPAEYQTVSKMEMVKDGYMEWRQVLCQTNMSSDVVKKIQSALKTAGHNPGPIDGFIGSQTTNAVQAYQKTKGLPHGGLTYETLKSLGIDMSRYSSGN